MHVNRVCEGLRVCIESGLIEYVEKMCDNASVVYEDEDEEM